ncbi:hypothetical protein [Salidesulfovibrio onnuriiensis]|uniref:hypothetical protein n=1 Tax=Salidesulfovibrio onnuriiensis TaxID=2583823 RepID=UPI0011CB9868|nr:hypothetical protein [Salidesulfovibrio onnuriiensis]
MEAVPAIGGISEYESPKTKEVRIERERPEQIAEKTMQDLEKAVIKAHDQDQSFKQSVLNAAYTGKGSFIDTIF